MAIELTLNCEACKNQIDQKGKFKGDTLDELDVTMHEAGWIKTKSGMYVGPKCEGIYECINNMKQVNKKDKKDKKDKNKESPIEFKNKEPPIESIMGYQSRYCNLGFKSEYGKVSHEKKFHFNLFEPQLPRVEKKTQILKINFWRMDAQELCNKFN